MSQRTQRAFPLLLAHTLQALTYPDTNVLYAQMVSVARPIFSGGPTLWPDTQSHDLVRNAVMCAETREERYQSQLAVSNEEASHLARSCVISTMGNEDASLLRCV